MMTTGEVLTAAIGTWWDRHLPWRRKKLARLEREFVQRYVAALDIDWQNIAVTADKISDVAILKSPLSH